MPMAFFCLVDRLGVCVCVCVCVCVTLGVIGILLDLFSIIAGGSWTHGWHEPTKTHPCRRDTRPDQSGVPAIFLPF